MANEERGGKGEAESAKSGASAVLLQRRQRRAAAPRFRLRPQVRLLRRLRLRRLRTSPQVRSHTSLCALALMPCALLRARRSARAEAPREGAEARREVAGTGAERYVKRAFQPWRKILTHLRTLQRRRLRVPARAEARARRRRPLLLRRHPLRL